MKLPNTSSPIRQSLPVCYKTGPYSLQRSVEMVERQLGVERVRHHRQHVGHRQHRAYRRLQNLPRASRLHHRPHLAETVFQYLNVAHVVLVLNGQCDGFCIATRAFILNASWSPVEIIKEKT
jgi:hypothetical protein